MYYFFDKVNNTEYYRQLLNDTRDKQFVAAFGVQPNEKPFIAANVNGFCLYVTGDYVEAQRVLRAVEALAPGRAVYLPAKEDVLLYKSNSSKNAVFSRNYALYRILTGAEIAVTTVNALMQYLPDRKTFFDDCFTLKKNVCYDTAILTRRLVASGYKRVDSISNEGEFVMRGDIFDISLPFGKRYRVDFWDDEVEQIRIVDEEGLSVGETDKFFVYPLYDTTGMTSDALSKVEQYAERFRNKLSPNAHARLSEIISALSVSAAGGRVDSSWLVPFVQSSVLADYLPDDTTVLWDEPKNLSQRVNFCYREHVQRVANLIKAGEVLPIHEKALVPQEEVFRIQLPQMALQTLPYQSEWFHPQAIHQFKTGAVPSYTNASDDLAKDIHNWLRLGYETVIFAGTDGGKPTKDKLADCGVYATDADRLERGAADALVLSVGIERGFVSHTNKLVVIGTRDIGRGLNRQAIHKSRKQAFLSVEKGDYVVHDVHGIGLCEGIQKLSTPSGENKEYIVVLYKGGDRLYVPVDAANLLTRYSGGENPALSRLGGEDFAKVKSKVKASVREMSINLLKLYAEREKSRGFRYHIDEYLDEEFQQYFPYKATEDQVRCQKEIQHDLTGDKIMDRVLVGDVGYGKTEVAMRAAFDVVSNGYQVAVLAPTTILTEQHFKTFSERMSHFDIRVACLNRFRSVDEQKKILKDVASGGVDIIIGTHRLLSKDVKFNRLGLLILDEEQRFGVEHKEKIKALKTNVDVLTMTATPIPRTLHMALSGIRDISTITTPPVERIAVETYVVEENEALICDVITRELARGGQVFCVYNRVQTIDSYAARLQELMPDARITVAHGQMDESALEDAVMNFADGQSDILVCTTIIENGIDIPNVNTLIVIDADTLGLSQLYQLRGRVGRSDRLAYAYFTYRRDKILNETAYKRLSSVTEYSELGSGFKIAMKDLEIRGAGNILGREQHGHIMKVGYDMYARLLKEAVSELKGQKTEKKITTELEIDIDAYAPESYMPLQADRISFYRQLSDCNTLDEADSLQQQLSDVYGACPQSVLNLFAIARLKILASGAGVIKVTVRPSRGELLFADKQSLMRKEVFDALAAEGQRASLASDSYSIVFASADFMQKDRLLETLTNFLLGLQTK